MAKKDDEVTPPAVDPELEALRAHAAFPKFKKLVQAALEPEPGEETPPPEPPKEGDVFDFFDSIFGGGDK